MDTRRTVSLNGAKKENLSKRQQRFVEAVQQRIEGAGLRILPEERGSAGIDERYRRAQAAHGIIIFAFSQWEGQRLYRDQDKTIVFPSEFAHIMAVMAVAANRPLLVLREKNVAERGVLRRGYVHPVVNLPSSLDVEWLDEPEFGSEFTNWVAQVNCLLHVFLGYSSQATAAANVVHKFLTEKLGVKVFDWHDFRTGDTIWDSIERAERLTNCGVFMFMADDKISAGKNRQLAPRDNVVYEAGYFAGAKGRAQSLIIREEGAKIPTDLGGILYLPLTNRADIAPIETRLREHLERMLNGEESVSH